MKMFLVLMAALAFVGCETAGTIPNPNPGPTPAPFDCQNPVGGIVKHTESVTLFQSKEVPYGQVCTSEVRTCTNGVLSGTAKEATCLVLPEQEPATHEKPVQISDEGLKMGGIKELGDQYVIQGSDRRFSPVPPPRPICSTIPNLGSECSRNMPICMNAEGTYEYSCEVKKTYKVFGWIYEKNGLDHSKMATPVSAQVFWFAGCLVGFCDPMAGPVTTDKWGYFEFTTSWLQDTLALDGLPKYYAHCKDGKPIAGGGQYITDKVGKAIGPFKQYVVQPDSCNQNFLMKMFGAEEQAKELEGLNPNVEPIK